MFLHWTPSIERNTNWIQTSTEATLFDVVYANGQYCAVGTDGATYFSTDRTTWTQYNISGATTGDSVVGVTHNGSKFYAIYNDVSAGKCQIVETTGPGVGWTNSTTAFGTTAVGIKSDGAGLTVALSADRSVRREDTPNTSPWSTASNMFTSGTPLQLEFTDSKFWATSTGFVYVTSFATSSWTRYDITTGTPQPTRGIVADDSGDLVIVGDHDATDTGLYTSTTGGSSWSDLSGSTADYNSVAYGDGRFLAVDTTTATIELTSGTAFTDLGHTGTTADLNRVRWINNEFIAVGNGIWVLYASQ